MHRLMLLAALGLIAQAAYADKEINGLRSQHQYKCRDWENVLVSGIGLRISLKGECGALVISGSNNAVSIKTLNALELKGTNNSVSYGGNAQGRDPVIQDIGTANTVSVDLRLRGHWIPAEVAQESSDQYASPAALLVDPEQCNPTQTLQGAANGHVLHCEVGDRILIEGVAISTKIRGDCEVLCLSGSQNAITVEGDARVIAIRGSGNQVRAMRVDAVSLQGINNTVHFYRSYGGEGPKKDQPKLASKGLGNSALRRE